MNWIPAGHRVMVRPDDPPDKIGSLFVPAYVKDNRAVENVKGEIVAIGPTAWQAFDDGKPWAKVGDRVIFSKYGGFIIEDEITKEKYRILNDEDIVAVLQKGE